MRRWMPRPNVSRGRVSAWTGKGGRMVKIVILFLLVMVAFALFAGPGFRRALASILGMRGLGR